MSWLTSAKLAAAVAKAGGIVDNRGVKASFALGAEGDLDNGINKISNSIELITTYQKTHYFISIFSLLSAIFPSR